MRAKKTRFLAFLAVVYFIVNITEILNFIFYLSSVPAPLVLAPQGHMLMELGWRRLLRELLELSISWPEKHITGIVVNDDP